MTKDKKDKAFLKYQQEAITAAKDLYDKEIVKKVARAKSVAEIEHIMVTARHNS